MNLLHAPLYVETSQGRMLSIPTACLLPDRASPCDLFSGGPSELVLFARKGLPLRRDRLAALADNGVMHLLISDAEADVYFGYERAVFTELVRSPQVASEVKAQVVVTGCGESLRRVFAEPRGSFLERTTHLLEPTIELIARDGAALRHMVRLAAYDHATYIHSTNVGIFATAIARSFFGEGSERTLKLAAPGYFLHDLGKCDIPPAVLNNPEPLTGEDWAMVHRHPAEGAQRLVDAGWRRGEDAVTIVLQHHERDDGRGYPEGLVSAEIHPMARICRLADVFEALTADRPYSPRRSASAALRQMAMQATGALDRELLRHLVRLLES